VWAQQLDENDPSKPIGKPTQVTTEVLQGMLIQTRDPNKFVKMLQEQQAAASKIRYENAHGAHFKVEERQGERRLDIMEETNRESGRNRAEAIKVREEGAATRNQLRSDQLTENQRQFDLRSKEIEYQHDETNRQRDAAQQLREQQAADKALNDPATRQRAVAVDRETTGLYGPDGKAEASGSIADPERRAAASRLHTDMRMNGDMNATEAYTVSTGVMNGSLQIGQTKDGAYGVFAKGQTQPRAIITKDTYSRLFNLLSPQGKGAIPAPTVVRPGASAIPMPNAPSTNRVQ
jgi:hypothetical protein